MILINLFTFCLSFIKWIILRLILSIDNILVYMMKILNGENKRRIKIAKVYVEKNIQAQEKTQMKKLYCIKFDKFNVVKMENSKRNRRNLRFKLAFERFILIIMIIKKFNCIYHTTK